MIVLHMLSSTSMRLDYCQKKSFRAFLAANRGPRLRTITLQDPARLGLTCVRSRMKPRCARRVLYWRTLRNHRSEAAVKWQSPISLRKGTRIYLRILRRRFGPVVQRRPIHLWDLLGSVQRLQ